MGMMDALNPEDRTEMKISTLYEMLREAARAELIMNAVNCNVPHKFIREMITGESESCPEAIVSFETLKRVINNEMDDGKLEAAAQAMRSGGVAKKLEKEQPEIKTHPEAEHAAEKQQTAANEKSGRNPFDTGKMIALLEGGWSVAKIADEMRVSEATIYNHMKKEGITIRKDKDK